MFVINKHIRGPTVGRTVPPSIIRIQPPPQPSKHKATGDLSAFAFSIWRVNVKNICRHFFPWRTCRFIELATTRVKRTRA